MSYSFTVREATKLAALGAVAAKLDAIVEQQPVHAADRNLTDAAAANIVEMLEEPGERDVFVSIAGSIYKIDAGVQQISLNISANLPPRC